MILINLFYWGFEAAEIDNCACPGLVNIDGSYYCFWLNFVMKHVCAKMNSLINLICLIGVNAKRLSWKT